MNDTVISVENLTKEYRLGVINHGTLHQDLQSWWARIRGREDPNSLVSSSLNPEAPNKNPHLLALNDISFDVKEGEVLGIIGRNGAGKSTLLKILSRITSPSKGTVKIKGRVASLLEVGTGFHPELTGRENIFLNGALLGMSRREIKSNFDEIVAFSEIEKFIDTPVKRYSSGMYVRLAFAVAAHLDSEILIVDEVLAVGDAQFQKKCMGKIGAVAQGGRTVLFVSHNMEAINNLCETSLLLKQGSLELSGTTKDIIKYYMDSLFLENNEFRYVRDRKKQEAAVEIRIVELLKNNKDANFFDVSEEIKIDIHYEVVKSAPNVFLGIQTRTALGQPVFTSTSIDTLETEEPPSGICFNESDLIVKQGKASVAIPAYLLNVGVYELHIAAFARGRGLIDLMDNIYFKVCDKGSFASRPFNSERQGVILQKIPWEIRNGLVEREV